MARLRDGVRIFVEPGKTRPATEEDEADLKYMRDLTEAACEAEDQFDPDELERYAETWRKKGGQ